MAAFEQDYFENSQSSFYRDGYTYEMFLSHWEEKIPYLLRRTQPHVALDIGCAKGFLVDQLRSQAVDAYGVDVSDYAIGAAPPQVRPYLRRANICEERVPFPDDHFDLITCLEVIEHLPDPTPGLREIARVLAPQGVAFFSTPSPLEEEEKADVTHCSILSFEQWRAMFAACGMILRRIPAWHLAGDRGRLGRLPFRVRQPIRNVFYPVRNALLGEQNQHLFLEARKVGG